jgi:hypothetical protein
LPESEILPVRSDFMSIILFRIQPIAHTGLILAHICSAAAFLWLTKCNARPSICGGRTGLFAPSNPRGGDASAGGGTKAAEHPLFAPAFGPYASQRYDFGASAMEPWAEAKAS